MCAHTSSGTAIDKGRIYTQVGRDIQHIYCICMMCENDRDLDRLGSLKSCLYCRELLRYQVYIVETITMKTTRQDGGKDRGSVSQFLGFFSLVHALSSVYIYHWEMYLKYCSIMQNYFGVQETTDLNFPLSFYNSFSNKWINTLHKSRIYLFIYLLFQLHQLKLLDSALPDSQLPTTS